ncbi:MAG: peptide deformylase [Synergistaceae bacterium]|jgi:peptide deformylase|nr:peptide deformylase [Synergistaceae bacterium]
MREDTAKKTTTEKTPSGDELKIEGSKIEELKIEGLKIKVYPDPVLKIPATPVERFDAKLSSFVDEMHKAMLLREGVGLAAPQVGVSKKIAIITYDGVFYVLINPRLLEREGEQEGEEGCLSFPGIYAPVKRPARVKVAAQDTGGIERVYEVEGFTARAFLHEMDHLEGKLFIEYLSTLKRGMIRKKMYKRAIGEDE